MKKKLIAFTMICAAGLSAGANSPFAATSPSAEPKIVSWIDNEGRTHYQNSTPAPSKPADKSSEKEADKNKPASTPPEKGQQEPPENGIPSWTDNAGHRHYIDSDNMVTIVRPPEPPPQAMPETKAPAEPAATAPPNTVFVPVPVYIPRPEKHVEQHTEKSTRHDKKTDAACKTEKSKRTEEDQK